MDALLHCKDVEAMQVTCPACSTRYTTDDAKVRGKTVRMRCRACDTVWLVSGPSSGPSQVPATEPLPPASRMPAELPFEPYQSYAQREETPPERRAAVVKRGAEREKRDLFAMGSVDEGFVKQTLRPPPPGYGGGGGIGARSEDSVLFTLDSLRSEGDAPRSAKPAPARVQEAHASEDDGVIDLAALSQRPRAAAAAPLGVTSFASEPPGGFARDMSAPFGATAAPPPVKKKGTRLAAFGGSFVAVAIAAASAIALFGGDIPHRASRPTASLAPRAAAVGARAHEREVARAEAERKASEHDAAASASKDEGTRSKSTRAVRWTGPARGGAGASAPKAPPVKSSVPADACGCKGDFTCILRCSAKGK